MARRCASFSRTLLSTTRPSTLNSSPNLQSLLGQRPQSRTTLSTILSRTNGALGCTQSLLPLHSAVASTRLTSQIQMEARSCCQLSQGTFFCRTCPDRYLRLHNLLAGKAAVPNILEDFPLTLPLEYKVELDGKCVDYTIKHAWFFPSYTHPCHAPETVIWMSKKDSSGVPTQIWTPEGNLFKFGPCNKVLGDR